MARFVVDLGNVKLSEDQHQEIAAAIQGTVLAHLARNHRAPENLEMSFDRPRFAGMIGRSVARLLQEENSQ